MERAFPCWTPDLDLSRVELLTLIEESKQGLEIAENDLQQQQPMNAAVAAYERALDSYLYMLVAADLDSVDDYEQGPRIQDHRAWLRLREAAKDSGYFEYYGGSLAPYASGKQGVKYTLQRIEELERGD